MDNISKNVQENCKISSKQCMQRKMVREGVRK